MSTAARRHAAALAACLALGAGWIALGRQRAADVHTPCWCVRSGCADGQRMVADVAIVAAPRPHVRCGGTTVAMHLPPPPTAYALGVPWIAQPGMPGFASAWRGDVTRASIAGEWRRGAVVVDGWLPHPWRPAKQAAAVLALIAWAALTARSLRRQPWRT